MHFWLRGWYQNIPNQRAPTLCNSLAMYYKYCTPADALADSVFFMFFVLLEIRKKFSPEQEVLGA